MARRESLDILLEGIAAVRAVGAGRSETPHRDTVAVTLASVARDRMMAQRGPVGDGE